MKINENFIVGNKTRYFENSNIHIIKQRSSQVFLILTSFLSKEDTDSIEILLDIALSNIEAPSQQLSVRYMYEWLIMKLAKIDKILIVTKIKDCLEKSKTSRLGIIPAYISILSHQADIEDAEEILDIISPWCFGQHFMTRLCANSCFMKVFTILSNPGEKYLYIKKCIEETLHQGDFEKNLEKSFNDFYLQDFDPLVNYNLSDIFHNIPRLMNINDVIKDHIWTISKNSSIIPLTNTSSVLSQHRDKFCRCILCHSISNVSLTDMSILNNESFCEVQKKITPWKQMFNLEQESKRSPAHPDLIIVASLIGMNFNILLIFRLSTGSSVHYPKLKEKKCLNVFIVSISL